MLKYNVLMIMEMLDSSVKHWNDITGALEFLFQYLYISHASEQIL
ncbi:MULTISPECIES: hypothetical protein [Wolbachia]|nr:MULTISPECIES: hypothetical protein [unclassified Wolbachia]